MRNYLFLFFLFISTVLCSQEIYENQVSILHFQLIEKENNKPIKDIIVRLRAYDFEVVKKTDTNGKAVFKLPPNRNFDLLLNGKLYTNIKTAKFGNEKIAKNIQINRNDVAEVNDNLELKDLTMKVISDKALVKIKIKNIRNQQFIANELVTLQSERDNQLIQQKTNQNGEAIFQLNYGQKWLIKLTDKPNAGSLYFQKENGKSEYEVEIDYWDAAFELERKNKMALEIQKIEAEKQVLRKELSNKLSNLKNQSNQKNQKVTLIKQFETASKIKDDLEEYKTAFDLWQERKISMKIVSSSKDYNAPVIAQIYNHTNQNLSVIIENGRNLKPENYNYQTLIIVKKEIFELKPFQSLEIPLKAMCTASSKNAPGNGIVYTMTEMANPYFLTVSRCIELNSFYGGLGQHSIWVLSDAKPISGINSFNEKDAFMMRNLLYHLTDKTPDYEGEYAQVLKSLDTEIDQKREEMNRPLSDYEQNLNNQNFKSKVSGGFQYTLQKSSEILVAMFNENGILVRELISQTYPAGKHQFNFAFDSSVYTDEVYFIKLIVDGEVERFMRKEKNKN